VPATTGREGVVPSEAKQDRDMKEICELTIDDLDVVWGGKDTIIHIPLTDISIAIVDKEVFVCTPQMGCNPLPK
jgi:hypothetical protein